MKIFPFTVVHGTEINAYMLSIQSALSQDRRFQTLLSLEREKIVSSWSEDSGYECMYIAVVFGEVYC